MTIGGAVLFRDYRGKRQWLIVKQKEDGDWEIPKVTVRRGESSVRSVIRLTAEQAGMSIRVLEEAGRSTGNTVVNGKPVSQKLYYYLMVFRAGGQDAIGFSDFEWQEYALALRKISTKKEKDILRSAREVLKGWEKTHNKRLLQE